MIHEASLRVLILSTIFLKEAAAYGLNLSEIGEMMAGSSVGKKRSQASLRFCVWKQEIELRKEH